MSELNYITEMLELKNNNIKFYDNCYHKEKIKGVFTSDNSLMKCLYLSTKNIEKKWTTRYSNWDMIYNELNILYPDRLI